MQRGPTGIGAATAPSASPLLLRAMTGLGVLRACAGSGMAGGLLTRLAIVSRQTLVCGEPYCWPLASRRAIAKHRAGHRDRFLDDVLNRCAAHGWHVCRYVSDAAASRGRGLGVTDGRRADRTQLCASCRASPWARAIAHASGRPRPDHDLDGSNPDGISLPSWSGQPGQPGQPAIGSGGMAWRVLSRHPSAPTAAEAGIVRH